MQELFTFTKLSGSRCGMRADDLADVKKMKGFDCRSGNPIHVQVNVFDLFCFRLSRLRFVALDSSNRIRIVNNSCFDVRSS